MSAHNSDLSQFLPHINKLRPSQNKQTNKIHFETINQLYQNIFYHGKYKLKHLIAQHFELHVIDKILYFLLMNTDLLLPSTLEPKTTMQYEFISHLLNDRISLDNHKYQINQHNKISSTIYGRFIKTIVNIIKDQTLKIQNYELTHPLFNELIYILLQFASIGQLQRYYLIQQCKCITILGKYYIEFHKYIFHTSSSSQLVNLILLLSTLLRCSRTKDQNCIDTTYVFSPVSLLYKTEKGKCTKYSLINLSTTALRLLNNRGFFELLFMDIIYHMDNSPRLYSVFESVKNIIIHWCFEDEIFSKNIYDILCFHLDTVHVIHIYKIFDLIDAWISILHDGLQPFRFRLVWNTTYDDYSGIYLGLFRNIPLKHMQDISVSPLKGFMCMFFVLHLFCKYYNFYTIIGKECFDHESLSWKHWLIPFNDYWLRIVKTHNHKRRFRNLEMLLYAHDFCHRFANRMEKLFEWSKYYPNQRELLFYKNEIKDMTNLNGILINGTLTKYELTMIMSYNIRHMEELTGWAYIPHDVIIMIQKLVSLSTYSTKKTQPLKVRDLHTENSRVFPFDQFDVKTGQWFACTAAWSDESLVVNNTFHMVAHNKNCIDSEQILLNYQALTHEDYSQHLYVEDTFCIKVGIVSARLPYKYRSWKLLQYIFVNMKHEFISMPHIDEILPRFHVKNESWIMVQIIEMQSWCGQIRVVFITGATKWYHIDDEFHVMSIYEMKQKQLKKLLTNTSIGLGNKMYWQNRLNQMIQLHIVFFKSVVGINSIQQFYTEIKSPSAETKQIINIPSFNIFPLTKHQFDILVKIRDFSLRKEENKYWNDPKEKKLFMLKYISQTKQWKIERSDRLYQIAATDKSIITEKLPYRKSLQKYSTKNINKIIDQYKHHAQVQEFNIFDGENAIMPIDPRDMYKYYQNNYDLKSTYTQETASEYDEKKEIIEDDIAENIDLWNMELVIDTSILRCELIETGKIARSQIVRVKQQQYLDSFVYDFKKNYRKHGLFGVRGRGKRAVKNHNNQRSKGRGRGRGRGFQVRMDNYYHWSAW